MVDTGCGRGGANAKGAMSFSSKIEADVLASELIEEDVVVGAELPQKDCTGLITVEEFRLLLSVDPKCGTEVVEVRYAKPLSVLMIQEDEGRVLGVEPCIERG